MKIKFIFAIIYLVLFINCQKNQNDLNNFIDWGKKNEVEFSPLIEISTNKGTLAFIAKEDIEERKELLKIPREIIFNVGNALKLMDSKELQSQYENFQKLDIQTYEPHHVDLQKEEMFFSYLIYLIKHEPQLFNNTKFYEKYHLFIKSLEDYLPKSPLFYTSDQIEYLSGTYLGKFHDRIKKLFQEEIKIFKNESYYNKDIDYKEYAHNRLTLQNKGVNMYAHIHLIPFLNYFERDYMKYNARLIIERTGDVTIMSKKFIKKDEVIIVNSPKRTNVERLIFEGELNYYMVNYKENYLIPAFSPGLYYKYDIDDIDLYVTHFINLADDKFDERALYIYKNYTNLFKKNDDSDIWAYELLLENINYYKDYVDTFNMEKIKKIFEDQVDQMHIDGAMKGEAKVLLKSAKYIQTKLDDLKKNKEDSKKKSTDL